MGRTRARRITGAGFRMAAAVAVTTCVVACGGEVRGLEDDTPAVRAEDGGTLPPPDPGTVSTPGGAARAPNGPETDLPDCKLGTRVRELSECRYLFDGRCYDTKLSACACACKQKTGTVCSSGFPATGVPTTVTCG